MDKINSNAEKILTYIVDSLENDRNNVLVCEVKKLTDLVGTKIKVEMSLAYLKKEGLIKTYQRDQNSVRVALADKGRRYILDSDETKKEDFNGKQSQSNEDSKQPKVMRGSDKPAFEDACEQIHQFVLERFIKKRYQDAKLNGDHYQAYSDLFQLFVSVTKDGTKEELPCENLFKFIAEKINRVKAENFIKVLGPDGTGKSTFLSILYIFLYECYLEGKIRDYPFYINLHYYDRQPIKGENNREISRNADIMMQSDMKELIQLSQANENINFLIIIDGNEKYNRTCLNANFLLDEIAKKLKGHKKIICIGEKTNVHIKRDKEVGQRLVEKTTTYTFHFSPVYINENQKWHHVIRKYCKMVGKEEQIAKIINCIDRFNIKEVDYNLLTVLGECSDICSLDEFDSISEMYHTYCLRYLSRSEDALKASVDLSYRYFMTTEAIKQQEITGKWQEWELVHQHKTISNYLLATYYSDFVLDGKPEHIGEFEWVFTNGINVFLKSILNESILKQKATLQFCEKLFKDGGYRAQAQAAYLLGTIQDEDLQEQSKKNLNSHLKKWSIKDIREDEEKRERYFVKRSILASLMHLGDGDAGEQFLKDLFDKPVMSEVNRAFYLQYYDDVRLELEKVNLKDDGKSPISHTVSVLFNYTNSHLEREESELTKANEYQFQIHLYTLCSLVQKRFKPYIDKGIVVKLKKIIDAALKNELISLNDDMQIYLQMLKEDLQSQSYQARHLYNELYKVKNIERAEWVKNIEKTGMEGRYENVVEHVYYSWLLGMLFLPEKYSAKFYDKNKILNYILTDGLAKAYTGDKLSEEIREKDIKQEYECMLKIFMHDKYDDISNMDQYKKIWEDSRNQAKGINRCIAKEIEIIQTLYQYSLYVRQGAEISEERKERMLKNRWEIKTDLGKGILSKVVKRNFPDIFSDTEKKKNRSAE